MSLSVHKIGFGRQLVAASDLHRRERSAIEATQAACLQGFASKLQRANQPHFAEKGPELMGEAPGCP
jgi:hypothetical protein